MAYNSDLHRITNKKQRIYLKKNKTFPHWAVTCEEATVGGPDAEDELAMPSLQKFFHCLLQNDKGLKLPPDAQVSF